ncbi:10625_t:CDS:2, partial [Paraglomus occultum]
KGTYDIDMSDSGGSNEVYCLWHITIYNCRDSGYFVAVYFANAIISTVALILVGMIVFMRVRANSKPVLWKHGTFAPLEGFLLFVTMCLTDIFPTNWIFRELISDFQWMFAVICIITYLAGIFRAIPQMEFFQPSQVRITNVYVPTLSVIRAGYWLFVVFTVFVPETAATLAGYFRMHDNQYLTDVFTAVRLLCYTVSSVLISLGFIIYGRMLVRLTRASFTIVQGRGAVEGDRTYPTGMWEQESRMVYDANRPVPVTVQTERERETERAFRHKKFKYDLRRMRTFNYAAISIYGFFGVTSFALAFWYKTIFANMLLSKLQAFAANVGSPMTAMTVLVAILLSEIVRCRGVTSGARQ